MALGSLVVELSANVARFQSDMGKVAYVAEQNAKRVDQAFGVVNAGLKSLGAGLAVGLTFDAIKSKIQGVIDSAAGLKSLSERTGATVEGLSGLASVARLSGTDTEALAGGLQKLSKSLVGLQSGSAETTAAFAAIGFAAKDFIGLRPDEAFQKIAGRLSEYSDGVEKTALLQVLLGKSGANLAPVLNDLAEAGELQIKVTREQAQLADDYDKTLKRLDAANGAIYKTIAFQVLPTLNSFAEAMLGAAKGTDGLRGSVEGLAKDDTLQSWGEGVAKAVGFAVDSVQGFTFVVTTFGRTLGATVAGFSALGSGGGIFSKAGRDAWAAVWAGFKEDVDRDLEKPFFSDRLARAIDASKLPAQQITPRKDIGDITGKLKADTSSLAKPQLDGYLKLLDAAIRSEDELLKRRESLLQRSYDQGQLSVEAYYEARRALVERNAANESAAYDAERAAIAKYIAATDDAKAKVEGSTRLSEVVEKQQQAAAKAIDETTRAWQDQADAQGKYQATVVQTSVRLLELKGRQEDAARLAATLDTADRQRARAQGDTGQLAALDALEKYKIVQGQVSDAQAAYNGLLDSLAIKEGRIDLARSQGSLTELEALASTSVARREQIGQLEQVLAKLQQIADASGDKQIQANVEALRLRLDQLQASADLVADKFNGVFKSSFEDAFAGFLDGTKTAGDAFKAFANSVISQLARIAAQEAATELFGKKSGGGGGSFFSSLAGLLSSSGGGGQYGGGDGSTFGGFRAAGGPVLGGSAYVVGERGPEVFRPSTSGRIDNNVGGAALTVNTYIDSRSDRADVRQQVQKAIQESTRQLVDAQRRGGAAWR